MLCGPCLNLMRSINSSARVRYRDRTRRRQPYWAPPSRAVVTARQAIESTLRICVDNVEVWKLGMPWSSILKSTQQATNLRTLCTEYACRLLQMLQNPLSRSSWHRFCRHHSYKLSLSSNTAEHHPNHKDHRSLIAPCSYRPHVVDVILHHLQCLFLVCLS